jgi:flagellar biosynthesis protein FlhB
MEGGDKTETPSQNKLQELRDEGIVPYSHAASFLLALGVMLLSCWALRHELLSWWGEFEGLVRSSGEPGVDALSVERLSQVSKNLIVLLLAPVCAGMAVVILSGLMQTHFLIKPGLTAFRGERIFALSGFQHLSSRAMGASAKLLLWLLVGSLLGALAASLGLGITRIDAGAFSKLSGGLLKGIVFTLGPLALAGGIAAMILEQLEFKRRHRMTRRELESEGGRD